MGYFSPPITGPSYERVFSNPDTKSKPVPIPLWAVETVLNGPADSRWPQAICQIRRMLREYKWQMHEEQAYERAREKDMDDAD